MYKVNIKSNESNQRLDRFLRKYLKDFALSDIYKLLRKNEVKVNGKKEKENYRLSEGDELEIYIDKKDEDIKSIAKCPENFTVIYEDENIIIVDKPQGIIVHPDEKHTMNTLVDQVIYYLYKKGEYIPTNEITFKPSAVNRLDINTGGIVLFAKNYRSLQNLSEMIRERQIVKKYICIVKGCLKQDIDIKSYHLKNSENNKAIVSLDRLKGSKEIRTKFKTLISDGSHSLLEVQLITGRSHQIRAQLAELQCPIIGDVKYGEESENKYFRDKFNLKNQFLYAYRVIFEKASGNLSYLQGLTYTSRIPEEYTYLINELFEYKL